MSPIRLILISGALAALSACTSYLAVDGDGHTTATPPSGAAAPATPVKGDTCEASKLQYLVGKPKTEAPVPVDPSKRRVYCSSCTITMDYRRDRLDIVFDKDSGNITAVKCG